MADELFRSNELLIRRRADHGSAACVVTFDSFTDVRNLDRPGFGEGFLSQAGIDAIHVLSRDNDWYQYPELPEAMQVIRDATRGYQRVISYGSSMGAYAAIRLAGLIGANAVLALSPQFSIDPDVVPWERRWADSARRFQPVWERTLPFPDVAEAYVVYDPTNKDRAHIKLLDEQFSFHGIGIPRAGHPVSGFLAQLGLLQRAVIAMCNGSFIAAEFEREAWARRKQSPQYLTNLAHATPLFRRRQRIALVRAAMAMAPNDGVVAVHLGRELAHAGKFEESLAMHRRSLELEPGHAYFTWEYSFSLEASGDLDTAHALIEELVEQRGVAVYQGRLDELRAARARRDAPLPLPEPEPAPAAVPQPAPPPAPRRLPWHARLLRPWRVGGARSRPT